MIALTIGGYVIIHKGYPTDILDLIGKEFLFRVESKEEALFNFDDCYRVKRVCIDQSVIAEFQGEVDEETPLKLKFSPAFTKPGASDTNACVMDL
ncbi:hypothetical protein SESBI_31617 [Sesbania bispinosa]|nr:hypothetical protein SESBI_31617 [Sesbania bispinosa]